MFRRVLACLCAATFLTATSAAGQFVQQGPPLETFSGLDDWYSGSHVSMSADGSVVAATAFHYRCIGTSCSGGATDAYVWSRSGAGWQTPTLLRTPSSNDGIDGVATSGDGNTIIVGNSTQGAVWVWRRSGATWSPDGTMLVDAGVAPPVHFLLSGLSVALSYDGATAIIGAPGRSAAWIWSRRAGVWTQTAKLLPDNAIGAAGLCSVSLSADGSTALVGLASDNNDTGAAWIWERTDGGWRQGPKLVASTAIGTAHQGSAVALSADGQAAIVGGPHDNDDVGAAWIWVRTGVGWSEVAKLVSSTSWYQGQSVGLSGDGRVAISGGYGADGALLWIKSGASWPQQGMKLRGSGFQGDRYEVQGLAVALSSDGTTAVSGTGGLEFINGAVYIFSAPPTALPGADMDGDGIADAAVWQPHTGRWRWQTAATEFDGARAGSKSWGRGDWGDVPLTGDVDGDRIDDLIVYRATTGVWHWLTSSSGFTRSGSTQWGVPSLGDRPMLADIDGDRIDDFIVWRPGTGVWQWLKSTTRYDATRAGSVAWGSGSVGDVPLTGDFDGDGRADVAVWRPADSTFYWLNAATLRTGLKQWGVSAAGDIPIVTDIDGDRRSDLAVWRPRTGTFYWVLSSRNYSSSAAGSAQWGVAGADTPSLGDMDGDGKADLIVWRASTSEWFWLESSASYLPSRAGYAHTPR
jgi:hypothetical protein